MLAALPLVSYKVHLVDRHVRAVPAEAADGTPFAGPGVDLRGDAAEAAIRAAGPILAWLDAREPGVVVRSISVRTAGPRVIVSLAPLRDSGEGPRGDARPRAMRFDPPYANELRDAGRDAERVIGEECARALERRRASAR